MRLVCLLVAAAALGAAATVAPGAQGGSTGELTARTDSSAVVVTRLRRLFAEDGASNPARCLDAPGLKLAASRRHTGQSAAANVAGYEAVGMGWSRFAAPGQAAAAFRGADAQAAARCVAARVAASSDARFRITATVRQERADVGSTSFASRIRLRFEPLACGCTPHPTETSVVASLDLVYGRLGRSLAWFTGVTAAREVPTAAERARLLRGVLG